MLLLPLLSALILFSSALTRTAALSVAGDLAVEDSLAGLSVEKGIAVDQPLPDLPKVPHLTKRCDDCDDDGNGGRGGGDYDWAADFCPRRFHRNRHGVCVRNGGRGGCRWGYRRSRFGFCIPDRNDFDSDDWRGGPNDGNCPRDFSPNGSGTDGFSLDFDGNGPPEWVPQGWAYFGEEIGWAPFAGWVPVSASWRPPTVFVQVWVRVSWWTPPEDWRDFFSTRWTFGDCPSFWNWQPRGRSSLDKRSPSPGPKRLGHGRVKRKVVVNKA